jgi:hypothetical protein
MNVVKVSPIAVLGPAAIFPAGCWVEDWRLQPGNLPKTGCELNWSMQHHLIEIFVFGGGVSEIRKTIWAFCGAEDGHLASLEGGRVVA